MGDRHAGRKLVDLEDGDRQDVRRADLVGGARRRSGGGEGLGSRGEPGRRDGGAVGGSGSARHLLAGYERALQSGVIGGCAAAGETERENHGRAGRRPRRRHVQLRDPRRRRHAPPEPADQMAQHLQELPSVA